MTKHQVTKCQLKSKHLTYYSETSFSISTKNCYGTLKIILMPRWFHDLRSKSFFNNNSCCSFRLQGCKAAHISVSTLFLSVKCLQKGVIQKCQKKKKKNPRNLRLYLSEVQRLFNAALCCFTKCSSQ